MTFRRMKVDPRPLFLRAMQIPTNLVSPEGEYGSARTTERKLPAVKKGMLALLCRFCMSDLFKKSSKLVLASLGV